MGPNKESEPAGRAAMPIALTLRQVNLVYRRYPHPRDALLEWLLGAERHEKFYALRDMTFELQAGTALGIVGDNGAGKSTLLRLLAGNLLPSSGDYAVRGRCSALLELGSGLDLECSGIENARVGLALRGLTPHEINEVLPEVLDFAELGEFVARPVKNYSSGMVVRLVFAIAAVLEPDVLIVDEALSVGDQYFQKKSLDRMREILAGGATLVFCSHNLYQLRELCQQAVWLEQGQIRMIGEAQQVVDAYQDAVRARTHPGHPVSTAFALCSVAAGDTGTPIAPQVTTSLGGAPILRAVELEHAAALTEDANQRPCFLTGQRFGVRVELDSAGVAEPDIHVGVVIRRNDEVQCYGISTLHDGISVQIDQTGVATVRFIIDSLPLLSGEYCLEVWLIDASGVHVYDARERCCYFRVQQASQQQGIGLSWLAHRWETTAQTAGAPANQCVQTRAAELAVGEEADGVVAT